MTDPAVTVIMATWNRGRHILPSIRSVLDQTRPDFELLVVGMPWRTIPKFTYAP